MKSRTMSAGSSNPAKPDDLWNDYFFNKDGEIVHKVNGKAHECRAEDHAENVALIAAFQCVLPKYFESRGKFYTLENADKQYFASHSWETADRDNRPLLIFLAGPRLRCHSGVLNVRVLLESGGGILAATVIGYIERCIQMNWHFISMTPLHHISTFVSSHALPESLVFNLLSSTVFPPPEVEALINCGDPAALAKPSRPVFIVSHGLSGPALLYPLRTSEPEIYRTYNPGFENYFVEAIPNSARTMATRSQSISESQPHSCGKGNSSEGVEPSLKSTLQNDSVKTMFDMFLPVESTLSHSTQTSSPAVALYMMRTSVSPNSAPHPSSNSSSMFCEETPNSNLSSVGTRKRAYDEALADTRSIDRSTSHLAAISLDNPNPVRRLDCTSATTSASNRLLINPRVLDEAEAVAQIWDEHRPHYLQLFDRYINGIVFVDSVVDLPNMGICDVQICKWLKMHSAQFLASPDPLGTRFTYIKDIPAFSGGSIHNVKLPRNVLDRIVSHFYHTINKKEPLQLEPLNMKFLNEFLHN